MRNAILISTACCMLAGCSNKGEAGVDSDKQINALSAEELATLCEWGVNLMESQETKCQSDSTTGQSSGSSTSKSDGFESTEEAVEDCKGDLADQFKDCDGTVEEVESCVVAHSKSPCISENDIPECKAMMMCGGDDDPYPSPSKDAGTMGDGWDSCYHEGASKFTEGGCNHKWRCPYGADRDLTCTQITDGFQCTCKNVKEGTEEGTFSSSDICTLESHNVAYRVNQSCGWQLPEN